MSVTNALGSIAGFYVGLQGPGPFWCQWYHDGVPLEDSGRIAGAHGPLLTVQVLGIDAGDYWVTVTNLFGSVTSGNAALTTLDLSALKTLNASGKARLGWLFIGCRHLPALK